jgi:hypothetical protein
MALIQIEEHKLQAGVREIGVEATRLKTYELRSLVDVKVICYLLTTVVEDRHP